MKQTGRHIAFQRVRRTIILPKHLFTLCAAATSVSMAVSCGALASMAMAGLLGHILMAFMLTSSASMVVSSARQAASIVGSAFLSAAWLIRVYVAGDVKVKVCSIAA